MSETPLGSKKAPPPSPSAPEEVKKKVKGVVLEYVPAQRRDEAEREIYSVVVSAMEEYSGNVMHPRLARDWERLRPGAAERLLSMAEKQENHRIWWEHFALSRSVLFQYLGLLFALVVSLALIGGALHCAIIGQPAVSMAFLATSAVGMVKVFLENPGRKREAQDSEVLPPNSSEDLCTITRDSN